MNKFSFISFDRLSERGIWSAIVCLVFLWSALTEVDNIKFWKDQRVLNNDIEAYYQYLPATFIYGDVRDLSFVNEVDARLHPNGDQLRFGIFHIEETGFDCIKYTYGVALFQAPLFLVAHAYCLWSNTEYPADGYSPPYQLFVSLSTVLFVFLGLLVLRGFLRRHVKDEAAALALLVLALGTNVFFYCTIGSGMSHGYLFFLFAVVLSSTDQWHRKPSILSAIILGAALGFTLLTRPVDALVILIPLLWTNGLGWKAKWKLVWKYRAHMALAILVAIIPIIPQLLYWKATAGHFIFDSYRTEKFNWLDPHIIDGLFSYRKGWFVYTPLAVLGFIGLALMLKDKRWRSLGIPILAFFPIAIYVIFSWATWSYGGGFGARPLVEALALLALPIAVLSQKIMDKHFVVGLIFGTVVFLGIYLNRFQQDQFLQTIIHWDSMSEERYWEVWGRNNWDGLEQIP